MGEAEKGCSFSLMCLEDGADLDGGLADSAGDGKLLLLYGGAEGEEDDEEYLDHLVSKESSLFCSPSTSSSSPSSPAFSDFSDAGTSPSPMVSSEDWFRCARRDTVKWILETRACFGFSHRTAYLAVAYFDRFCLHRCFDRSVMPWAARLLAVACVSVAAKMEEYRAPALPEFRADDDECEFSSVSIRRMELLVLSTLGWRMGGVTPFDYLPCLSSRLRRGNGGGGGALAAAKAAALIFSAAQAASVLDYRPSTVAVAAVLAATHGAMTKEALESTVNILSPSCLLDKDDVYACHGLMLSSSASSSAATSTTAKRPPPTTSAAEADSVVAGGITYESPSVGAASSSAAPASCNKRARLLELPAVGR